MLSKLWQSLLPVLAIALPEAEDTGDMYRLSQRAWPRHSAGEKGATYSRFYPYFLEQFRTLSTFSMLEIGLDRGGSLNLWKTYFPRALRIVGTDIQEKSRFHDGKLVRIFKARQQTRLFMGEHGDVRSGHHHRHQADG